MADPQTVTRKSCAKSGRCSGVGNCFVLHASSNQLLLLLNNLIYPRMDSSGARVKLNKHQHPNLACPSVLPDGRSFRRAL
jgi:hypothetical protein